MAEWIYNDIEDYAQLRHADGIDGVSFESLGLQVLSIKEGNNRPAPKEGELTFYATEGYSINKKDQGNIVIEAMIKAPTYEAFYDVIAALIGMIMQPDLRYLSLGNAALCSFFVEQGIATSQVNVLTNQTFGKMSIPLNYQRLKPVNSIPTNLSTTDITAAQIALAWNDNSTIEAGYLIERKTDGGAWSQIADLAPNKNAFIDTLNITS